MSPGEKYGFMLPESTVSVRYQPKFGSTPSSRSASRAKPRKSRASRSTTLRPFLVLRPGTFDRLLVGRGALGAREGVADRGRLVLQRVACPARERQRHAQVVGRPVRQRAEVRQRQRAPDDR